MINDSYTNDKSSDIRRTYNVTLIIDDDSMLVGPQNQLWINRYLRPYVGILNNRTQEILWYVKGTFTLSNVSYSYDPVTYTLSLSCNDLMAELTGDRDGQTDGLKLTIPADSNIREVIISSITQLGKVKKYRVDDIQKAIPYDLKFEAGTTVYEILKKINELYSGWEFFFDMDGTFIWQEIPNSNFEDRILDDSILSPLIVKETLNRPINIKNVTEVWGKCLEPDRFAQSCSFADNTYSATFDNMSELGSTVTYAMKVSETNTAHPKVHILGNNSGSLTDLGTFDIILNDILDEKARKNKIDKYKNQIEVLQWQLNQTSNSIEIERLNAQIAIINGKIDDINNQQMEYVVPGYFQPNTTYVLKYQNQKMYLEGQFQIHAIYKNEIFDCPFSIHNLGREIWDIKSGGEYDNIYSDELAIQRAKLENHLTTIYQDTLNLDMVDIPWLETNKKIKYTVQSTGETLEFIISSINSSSSEGSMSVTLIRFYEDWTVST